MTACVAVCPACGTPMPLTPPIRDLLVPGARRYCPCRVQGAFAAPGAPPRPPGEPSAYDRPLAVRLARWIARHGPARTPALQLFSGASTARVLRALACRWFRGAKGRWELTAAGSEAALGDEP